MFKILYETRLSPRFIGLGFRRSCSPKGLKIAEIILHIWDRVIVYERIWYTRERAFLSGRKDV